MDDIPDQETLQEWIEGHDLDRRDVLKAAALFTGWGWLFRNQLPTARNTDSRLTEAEEHASRLAEQLDGTDLRDPLMMSGLTPMVERTIETINDVLHDGTVTSGVWVAEKHRQVTTVLSILPGVDAPPSQSRPAARQARLDTVLTYYQSLTDVLQHVASTQRVLATVETPALYDGDHPDQALSSIIDLDAIETSIEASSRVGEHAANENSADSLLPDTEQVTAQLNTQVQIQRRFNTAIQTYLDTADLIETGARQHEQGNLDQANKRFHAAKDAIPEKVLESDRPYAISHDGPTLRDYATHFTKRSQGLTQLIAACDPDIDASTQNTRFNDGLTHLINARGVVKQ
ncbi:hypothetical protein B4589_004585 [Halolamina sp. CBA1230]|uniref:hypothetical protein n=1 Tax=Halolamina sp. CBA1230 TaxID=1853690 RepID=UPI0009A1C950|nr:hypothetical protein [Halolamina sp. CBA1230]QKY19690.1 hypothetical protein B4589_004585 [Halolamina sp. CBA1230]